VRKNNLSIKDDRVERDRDEILHDVKRLKSEIQNFQNQIKHGDVIE